MSFSVLFSIAPPDRGAILWKVSPVRPKASSQEENVADSAREVAHECLKEGEAGNYYHADRMKPSLESWLRTWLSTVKAMKQTYLTKNNSKVGFVKSLGDVAKVPRYCVKALVTGKSMEFLPKFLPHFQEALALSPSFGSSMMKAVLKMGTYRDVRVPIPDDAFSFLGMEAALTLTKSLCYQQFLALGDEQQLPALSSEWEPHHH